MTKDEIIRMAREAGVHVDPISAYGALICSLERFAALVVGDFLECTGQYVTNDASREAAIQDAVQAEREACAKLVENIYTNGDGAEWWMKIAAVRIRAMAKNDG